MGKYITKFLDFVDNRMVVRRIMLGIVAWMFVDSYIWAKQYAVRPGITGLELSAVIAAVLIPATYILKELVQSYTDMRKDSNATPPV